MSGKLMSHPVHLGLGAKAIAQPEFTGMSWYEDYVARTAADGMDGRLVSMHHFTKSWDSWEMHPAGDEVVICIEGEMALIQEHDDGTSTRHTIRSGDYAINPPGCWHTADVESEATAIFITCGAGTQHRPR